MFKHTRKFILSTALVAMMSVGGVAMAENKDLVDHDFVNYETQGLGKTENLDLNRYINYEEREACQGYRKPPSPFHRSSCKLWRGKRLDYTLYFDTGSDNIRGGEQHTLNKISNAIKKYNPREVIIVGHTDAQGSSDYNDALAQKRVSSVTRALMSKGVPEILIESEAEGEDRLAIETEDGVAHQSNRRVTVLLVN